MNLSVPLTLTSKGLFLLDLNDLVKPMDQSNNSSRPAGTHASLVEQTGEHAVDDHSHNVFLVDPKSNLDHVRFDEENDDDATTSGDDENGPRAA